MKGIMFNEKYGLESAVFNGTKTRTWRADKQPRYEVGENVAIKQCYKDIMIYNLTSDLSKYIDNITLYRGQAGWRNKMFVKNELMPHQIRITSVKKCRLQEITEEECLKEGVNAYKQGNETYYNCKGILYKRRRCVLAPFITAKEVFFNLIEKLNGRGYWESNPDGYAYEFELVK